MSKIEEGKEKEILVTGGAGYVGSHCCQFLASQGYKPIVIDHLKRGHDWAVKWGPLYRGDVRDSAFLERIFSNHRFQAVFHFAAYAYVGESVGNPHLYYENNLGSTLTLAAVMRKFKVQNLIFSSTCATYGIPTQVPIEESAQQNPVNPYGRSKLMAEKILADMVAADKMKVVCLRYFNAAGADPDAKIGEDHQPETHLIPLAIEAAYKNTELNVFGNDYPTKDGSCVRDYIHVRDLAMAHVLSLKWLEEQNQPTFEFFNLGTGVGHSVFEIVKTVEQVTKREIRKKIGPRREGDPPELVASGEKARRVLGWMPEISDLERIVQTADLWYRRHQRGEKN